MDWKQFIASIVGSVAWPIAIMVIAAMFRKQLVALLRRLGELTLPGGYKITFKEHLEDTSAALREVVQEKPEGLPPGRDTDFVLYSTNYDALLLDRLTPTAQLMVAYAEVLALIEELRVKFEFPTNTSPLTVIKKLHDKGRISASMVEALQNLMKARNAALHLPATGVEVGEAVQFVAQAKLIGDVLRGIRDRKGG